MVNYYHVVVLLLIFLENNNIFYSKFKLYDTMEQLSNGIVDNKCKFSFNLDHLPELSGAIHALKRDPHDKSETIPFKLIHKKQITHDSFIFTFELPHNMYLGIDLGQHLAIE